ncbi:platelet-activating factor acetylhydrolase [Colletotrichum orchidophilum]|uniref:1-alkyl-2-acetylglycerophosphocholine esterase n=1 Tax=Colletotrichum orchidophilum TaxID=1209926 RepID=A0A1G4BKH0_9PEZI|nr:platelet-activating factor acetylhydrolase [Colletotrichum orchidophilum]OHF01914.1 platelet-activating factor acetylhydrolase [Colletotrichum orchidophilum]
MKVQYPSAPTLCFWLSLARTVLGEPIPAPTGEYNVGAERFVVPFLDEKDVVWPNGVSTEYLVTLYYPTADEKPCPKPYLEAELTELYADLWTYNVSHLTSTVRWNATYLDDGTGPTLLFGPGGWGPPTDGNYIVISDLVSHGYVVAAFDHVYEQPFVRYPNGTGVFGLSPAFSNYTLDWVEKLHAIRIKQQLHFIDYFPSLVAELKAPFKFNDFGAFGVSLGGSAALTVALESDAVAAAINVDGTNWGRLNSTSDSDLRKPSMILSFQGHNANTDRTWNNYRTWQTGWWRLFSVDGSMHADWSDLTFWKSFGTTRPSGPVDGNRMVYISRTFIRAFFDDVLLHISQSILDSPSEDFPEVKWDEIHNEQ